MDRHTESVQNIQKELKELLSPRQDLLAQGITNVRTEQEQVIERINALSRQLDQIASKLSQKDFTSEVSRINSICSRIQNCNQRITSISIRARRMLLTLEPKIMSANKAAQIPEPTVPSQ